MGNLGKREQYYMMLLGIVVVVLVIYFFGIRNLGYKYDDLCTERTRLEEQLAYYEALKTQNDETLAQINQLKTQISDVEAQFLPYICAESIEQYVLKTFEDNGCVYLVSAQAEDITPAGITLPDGTPSTDNLLIKRITVQYSTTDGFNIPDYNRSNTVIFNGEVDQAAWDALLEEMYWHGSASIEGYDEFLAALVEIEEENPDCIKINSISIKAEGGYILLTASIDFYSATFNYRVSEADTSAPYVTWDGATNINTEGGIIGRPFIIDDPNSEWFNTLMSDEEATEGDRPFSTYYSSNIFEIAVEASDLLTVLDIDGLGAGANIPGGEEVPED